jgi:hypothetical protein
MKTLSLEPDLLVKIDGKQFPADYVAGHRADIDAVINSWRRIEQAEWPKLERNARGWRVYWAWPDTHFPHLRPRSSVKQTV